MHSEELRYEADGLNMRGQLYYDPRVTGARPGVLMFPEAFGLGDHALSRAENLAELGFVALACDLHGERVIHDVGTLGSIFGELMAAPERIRARARGGLDALRSRAEADPGRIAAIGYCFGGTMALELARAGDRIAGAVGFHSGLSSAAPASAGSVSAKLLVCVGADDPSIDRAQRAAFEEEMTKAGADWQMHVYGGVVHSFTNPEADSRGAPHFARYDKAADARSWAALRGFLDEIFAGP